MNPLKVETAMRDITYLRNQYSGDDCYIVAAGASAGFVSPSFFSGKLAIGVNEVYTRFPRLPYHIRKEATGMDEVVKAIQPHGGKLIISKYNSGSHTCGLNKTDQADYVFNHEENRLKEIDLSVLGEDKLIVSYSTITSAMHLAAYMGVYNIILVGHDCGLLDGHANFEGYPTATGGQEFYLRWITEIEPQTLIVKKALQNFYGCHIYSLNPFINFGLEGHHHAR